MFDERMNELDEWMGGKRTGSPEEAGHMLNTILQFIHSLTHAFTQY